MYTKSNLPATQHSKLSEAWVTRARSLLWGPQIQGLPDWKARNQEIEGSRKKAKQPHWALSSKLTTTDEISEAESPTAVVSLTECLGAIVGAMFSWKSWTHAGSPNVSGVVCRKQLPGVHAGGWIRSPGQLRNTNSTRRCD